MTGFGAQAYKKISVESAVTAADRHQLVVMLYDGVLEAIKQAAGHMAAGRIDDKGRLLGKAVRIVEEGLKASLDRGAGGALAERLAALYDYISLRLLQAHLRNDDRALAEVSRLLTDLRSAWANIGSTSPHTGFAGRAPAAGTEAARLVVSA
jgi:flagellar protein FliS